MENSVFEPQKLVILVDNLTNVAILKVQNDKKSVPFRQRYCHFNKKGAAFMKSTGIVRKVDELGRIVLPIELRRTLGIEEKDRIEIFVEGESVILRKYQPACIFCDNAKDLILYKGKNICPDCIRSMGAQL